jgi:hypothetical protein
MNCRSRLGNDQMVAGELSVLAMTVIVLQCREIASPIGYSNATYRAATYLQQLGDRA